MRHKERKLNMNRVKNRIFLNIIIIVIAIIFSIILVIGNVGRAVSNVAVVPGSYAEEYAEKNRLNVVKLADSQQIFFDQRYETFDYEVENDDTITLERYSGSSINLVIPAFIDGRLVTSLSEDFMKSLSTVKNAYISNAVREIGGEADT